MIPYAGIILLVGQSEDETTAQAHFTAELKSVNEDSSIALVEHYFKAKNKQNFCEWRFPNILVPTDGQLSDWIIGSTCPCPFNVCLIGLDIQVSVSPWYNNTRSSG